MQIVFHPKKKSLYIVLQIKILENIFETTQASWTEKNIYVVYWKAYLMILLLLWI